MAITTPTRITAISANGLELIKRYEEFRAQAYLCPAGVWTIGYGTTRYPDGQPVRKGDRTTMQDATKMLSFDCRRFSSSVDRYTRDDLTQNEFDALVSLCYNIGEAALAGSTVLRRVNLCEKDSRRMFDAFLMWNKDVQIVDGKKAVKTLDGLTNRRMSEATLFCENRLAFFFKGRETR